MSTMSLSQPKQWSASNLIAALVYFFHAGKQNGGILVFLPAPASVYPREQGVDVVHRKS